MILEVLKTKNSIFIVGAQSRAKTLKGYFSLLFPNVIIEAFWVDKPEENEKFIDGIPIEPINSDFEWDKSTPVFIATKGIYHATIVAVLKQKGAQEIIPVTAQVDNELRNAYVKKFFEINKMTFDKIDNLLIEARDNIEGSKSKGKIFVAKSVYDKTLKDNYRLACYEEEIQVGAALSKQRFDGNILADNVGENISEKNRQYCELTALYWVWKNCREYDVVGFAHYRRHFVLPENWMERMLVNNVDIILPVPTYVAPSISENYKERHDASDWEFLLSYLSEKYQEDYFLAKTVFEGNLYSPCNMFIARREVLDRLCAWMFPILDVVAEHGGQKEDVYLNRYPGFIAERLLTLFVEKNRKAFNIVYADKIFIS